MEMNTLILFNNMSDEDFIAIHEAGQLKNLCFALSLDLQEIKNEENTTYTA